MFFMLPPSLNVLKGQLYIDLPMRYLLNPLKGEILSIDVEYFFIVVNFEKLYKP
jgi:hypothetical protein